MRLVVAYKNKRDYSSTVDDFLRDIKYQTGHDLEIIDPETLAGSQFCETYDILEFPTVMAISNDGIIQNTWSGLPLPTISEISYYFQ